LCYSRELSAEIVEPRIELAHAAFDRRGTLSIRGYAAWRKARSTVTLAAARLSLALACSLVVRIFARRVASFRVILLG
jgi:hypothetical protein